MAYRITQDENSEYFEFFFFLIQVTKPSLASRSSPTYTYLICPQGGERMADSRHDLLINLLGRRH